MQRLIRILDDPYYALGRWMLRNHPTLMSDKWYLKVIWLKRMGYKLNLKTPVNFNEKLQWLKLYDHKSEYSIMVDKYRVKDFVADIIGEQYVIPTLAVWNSVEDINIDMLPNQFVLKCNHDSGSVVICRNKLTFDLNRAKEKLKNAFNRNYYWSAREWPYKSVKPVVFAEKYIEDSDSDALVDYKWFNFNGKPKFMYISRDRGRNPRTNFYDMDFNLLPFRMVDPNSEQVISKPLKFEEMKYLASKLSEKLPMVRTDFYMVDGKVYFGEFTFYHNGGYFTLTPPEWNRIIGEWLTLPPRTK